MVTGESVALATALRRYEQGKASIADVVRSSEIDERAERYHLKWKLPADVEPRDIAQEMRIGILTALADYEPGKSSAYSFTVFRLYAAAYKYVSKCRKAKHDVEPRYLVAISHLPGRDHDEERDADEWVGDAPDPTVRRDEAEVLESKLRSLTEEEACAVMAFVAHGSIDGAAEELGYSRSFRRATRVKNADEARDYVSYAVHKAATAEPCEERDNEHG